MGTEQQKEPVVLPNNLFQTTAPEMMRPARLLIIDHDVCTYHSFDLLCHMLYRDALTNDVEHLGRMRRPYRMLYDMDIPTMRRIHFMQTKVRDFDPRALFDVDYDASRKGYEETLRDMLRQRLVPRTVTDVGSRFDIVFQNRQITGFLLRYKDDPYRPSWGNMVTCYESESLLDLETAKYIIEHHNINAVMTGSVDMTVTLASHFGKRKNDGVNGTLTFIIGRYGYNYNFTGKVPIMRFTDRMEDLMIHSGYEFGNFEPFRGLYMYTEEEKAKAQAAVEGKEKQGNGNS